MSRIKQLRLVVMVTALTLALAAAAPAVAEPPAWSGGWVTNALDRLAVWWTAPWGSAPFGVGAASEVAPPLDPNHGAREPGEPEGLSLVDGQESTSEGEVLPNLDPDG